jgi:hypothetical protein
MVETDINKLWEKGVPHDPRSVEMFKWLAHFDFTTCGDYFRWKSGGDGDNGETFMYQLDVYFRTKDAKAGQ